MRFVSVLLLLVGLANLPVDGTATLEPDAASAAVTSCLSITTCLQPYQATAWADFLDEKPPCLSLRRVWWSSRPPELPVVLVTQLSADRLGQLAAQCTAWRGPIAAVLHMTLLFGDIKASGALSEAAEAKLVATEQQIEVMFHAAEVAGHCQLRALLLYELLAEPRAKSLYPVNSLRNYARLLADTELVANIDVDMIPSLSLSASLADMTTQASREYLEGCRNGAVYVLPAFDIQAKCGGPPYADATCLKPKEALLELIKEKCVIQFRQFKAPAAHNVTDFDRWSVSARPYTILYQDLFEPWLLSARTRTPWFDHRFRGYGKNKIVQAMHMNWTGTQFAVHSSGFLVHRPHSESRARKEFLGAKFGKGAKRDAAMKGSIYQHIEALYGRAKAAMAEGTYTTRADPGLVNCLEHLPWWKDIHWDRRL